MDYLVHPSFAGTASNQLLVNQSLNRIQETSQSALHNEGKKEPSGPPEQARWAWTNYPDAASKFPCDGVHDCAEEGDVQRVKFAQNSQNEYLHSYVEVDVEERWMLFLIFARF